MSNDEATDNASAAAEAVDPPAAPPAKVGVLHLALQALLNDVGRAFNFGDPTAFLAQAELAFKQTVADAFHELEQRIAAIETHPALSVPPLGAPAGAPADAKPVIAADGENTSGDSQDGGAQTAQDKAGAAPLMLIGKPPAPAADANASGSTET